MASSQECETDRDPRRTGLVATGVETIIDIVKSYADDTARARATADRGKHNHHRGNPPYSVVLAG
jgi:hypothetical protein